MKKILAAILTLCMVATFVPTLTAMAASDFASEVPASVDATKTQYNYVFNRANVGISSANIEEATSYSKVVSGDAWKFANQAGMENYSFNGDNGITLRTNVADVGNGANVVFALYVPKAGKYTFEYNSYSRDNSGSLDIYFAKCPADFVANSFGANLPFGESEKVADDLSFYVAGQTVIDYRALDNVVTVPEAGTYLVAFTDFKTVDGANYSSDSKIRQEIRSIRLTETFAGEIPAGAEADTEYNYVFGHEYVGLTANADVNGVTSYSQVTNTAATDYWKFAAKSDMANTTLNGGSNGVFINTNSSSSYMVMALYIPSAGKYNVSFDYIKRTDNCTFDMYFAKCPDTFAAGSGFPFVAGDKIAEDCSFGNGDPWSRGNVLDGVVEVPSAGTYLIGFTDSKISGVGAATNLTLYNIKLTQTFAGEVPAGAEADTEYNYVFGRKYVNISSNDTSLANRYSLINAAETDYWKFAGQSGMITCELNGDNGVFIKTNDSSSYMIMALYIPSAGKYNVSFDYIKRTDNCTLDMYFAKCSDTFVAGSGFPFVAGDKIAEDYSFGNGDPWSRDNVLEDVVEVPSAGTYLIGFTDSKIGGVGDSTNQTLYNIKLTREEEPEVPENPNAEITGNSVSIGLTAIVDGVASADAKALLSESSVTAGNVNSVKVGDSVTLKATDSADLKFLYWYNGNSGRIISDEAEYTFTAGTNTPIFAKYADVNAELTEYFSAAGQLIEESEGTFNTEPDRKLGNYYKLFKSTVAGAVYEAVEKIASAANFVCWTKDGEVVSYDETYTYTPWTGNEVVVEVAEGEKSDVPTVVLFENGNARMLELVNFNGIEIIEKGILFGGNLTVSSCAEKAISVEDKNQFSASSDETTARAYVIYKDGEIYRVAYSK